MQPLEFARYPLLLGRARFVRDDAHLVSVFSHCDQRIFGNAGWLFVVADHLSGNAQDSSRGAIVQGERLQQRLFRTRGVLGESLQKNSEAAERCPAKTVNRLAMISHDD